MSWFKRGQEGLDYSDNEAKKQAERSRDPGKIREFFQPRGSTTRMIFLDPGPIGSEYEPFIFDRHSQFSNNAMVRATCPGEDAGCPLCASGDRPKVTLAITAICKEPYNEQWHDQEHMVRDGNGQEWVYQKRVLALTWKAKENLQRNYQNRGNNLRFAIFDVSRGNHKQEAATGESFDFIGYMENPEATIKGIPMAEAPEDRIKPVDYEEYFALETPEEMRKMFGLPAPVGAVDDKTAAAPAAAPAQQQTPVQAPAADPFGGAPAAQANNAPAMF